MKTDDTEQRGPKSVKRAILLTEEQAEPFPISVEHLWFDKEGENFRLKNIPFLVDDLSFDDLVSLNEVHVDHYQIGKTIEASRNSTIWLSLRDETRGQAILNDLSALGCEMEGGLFPDYYAINVPSNVRLENVIGILEPAAAEDAILVDYPSIRHD